MRTLEELLREGKKLLEISGIEEAGLDAWLLLEYATGKNRAYYFAHPKEVCTPKEAECYRALIKKRAGHIPLQHLTHQAFFMGHEFYVDDKVLIPRQDTEILAEECLKLLKGRKSPLILDMCTGSGCILLSLLAEKEDAEGVGADISQDALFVAEKNARRLKVEDRALFVKSDTFSDVFFQEKSGKESRKYDILVSNPPYIPTEQIETLMEEVRLHDPRRALDGREDGLYFYRVITGQAGRYLKSGGWLLYEIGCGQGAQVSALMEQAGFSDIKVIKDLAGLDRVVLGQKT